MAFMALCALQSVARTHNNITFGITINIYNILYTYTAKADLQCECAYFITADLRLFLCSRTCTSLHNILLYTSYAYTAITIIRPCISAAFGQTIYILKYNLRRLPIVSDDCEAKEGTPCQNGACLDSLCHCNDGYGGCSCQVPGMHIHAHTAIYHYYTITMRLWYDGRIPRSTTATAGNRAGDLALRGNVSPADVKRRSADTAVVALSVSEQYNNIITMSL